MVMSKIYALCLIKFYCVSHASQQGSFLIKMCGKIVGNQ